ncbi:MAG: PilZ domain-containing protein [Chloroflexi bacterium]|nr:PilZ domain-containing protein [Chloroflexota bacterium]
MSEHRKEERRKLISFTPAYDAKKKTLLGYVYDLTMKGAMVIGERSAQVGEGITLRIDLPGNLENVSLPRLTIPARIAWCRPDESPGNFNIGFEFVEIDAENDGALQAVLERYQFRPDFPISS